jgi:hypothetical protein
VSDALHRRAWPHAAQLVAGDWGARDEDGRGDIVEDGAWPGVSVCVCGGVGGAHSEAVSCSVHIAFELLQSVHLDTSHNQPLMSRAQRVKWKGQHLSALQIVPRLQEAPPTPAPPTHAHSLASAPRGSLPQVLPAPHWLLFLLMVMTHTVQVLRIYVESRYNLDILTDWCSGLSGRHHPT